MSGSPRTQLLRFRKSFAKTILVIPLMVVTAMTAIMPQSEAADWIPSVAGNIPTDPTDAVRPFTVIDQDDIELSGMRNVFDLLLGRSTFNNFGVYRPLVLGLDRSAVLINGRRISDSNKDINILPISGVERIEILGDSAAALRGGDAMGGAVNIVLKRNFEGLQIQASPTWTTQPGGEFGQGSVLWGSKVGNGHLTMGLDVYRRAPILEDDRSHSRTSYTPDGPFADTTGVSVGGNTIYLDDTQGRTIARPLGNCKGSAYIKGLTNPRGHPGTGCGFSYAAISWHGSPSDRYNRESLFLNFDHPLGNDADMYLDFRAGWDKIALRWAPSTGRFSFSPSEALQQQLLQDPEITSVPDSIQVDHRFVGHGNRLWKTDTDAYDLTVGFRGTIFDTVHYNTYVRYYRHDAARIANTFVSNSLIQRATNEGRYDVENPLSTDPVHLAAIRETSITETRDVVTDHKTARVSFDGSTFALPGGDVKWALGTVFAREEQNLTYTRHDVNHTVYPSSDVLGSSGESFSGARQRWSTFTEIALPVIRDWDILLAGRMDDHDDVETTFSHQIATRYQAHRLLVLRGSWNRGSRAPSLSSLHTPETSSYPYVCDTKTFAGDLKDCPRHQVLSTGGGNPNLKPEDAETFSVGTVMSFHPFSLSIDWFQTRLTKIAGGLSAQEIIDLEVEGRLPSGAAVIRDGDLITKIVNPALVNSGESDIDGFNVRANMEWPTQWAHVRFDAYWVHATKSEARINGETIPGDFPRNRVHALIRVSRDSVTAQWSAIAKSEYSNTAGSARYKAWMGHNMSIRWRDALGVDGLDLNGGVLNIGNRGPSIAAQEQIDFSQDATRGRTFFLTAKISFDP